jgi:ELWxxDGT repeat protein
VHGLPERLIHVALAIVVVATSPAWGQGAPALLRDIDAPGSSSPASFATLGDVALFAATTAAEGRELWRTDGTTAGTTLVADLRPGTSSSRRRS